jgi:hypothetical protein
MTGNSTVAATVDPSTRLPADLPDLRGCPMTPGAACYFNPEEAAVLDDVTLARLRHQGLALGAIVAFPMPLRAHVSFQPGVDRYVPMVTGEAALIFAILDFDPYGDRAVIDLMAWRRGQIGTRLGVGACLGQEQIGQDALGMSDRPIPVFRDPLAWLRHRREGLVIAAWEAAAHLLADVALRPEDDRHAAELSHRLRIPRPIIVTARRDAA